MIEFDTNQRTLIADKLLDIANIAAGGMVFGQFLADRPFSIIVALTGVGVWAALFAFSMALQGRSGP